MNRHFLLTFLNNGHESNLKLQDAVLSQGVPRDAAVHFGTYQSFQRHRAVFTAITTLSN